MINWERVIPTKTLTYLFEPSLLMMHGQATAKAFLGSTFNLSKDHLRIVNVFLGDSNLNFYQLEHGMLHVIVDLSGKNAMKDLEFIRSSYFYVGDYVVNAKEPLIVVILFKSFRGKSYNEFLVSRYSLMYEVKMLESYKDKFISFEDRKKKIVVYKNNYKVLTNDEAYRKDLISDLFGNDKHPPILELDSKWNLHEEVVNIKAYCESIIEK